MTIPLYKKRAKRRPQTFLAWLVAVQMLVSYTVLPVLANNAKTYEGKQTEQVLDDHTVTNSAFDGDQFDVLSRESASGAFFDTGRLDAEESITGGALASSRPVATVQESKPDSSTSTNESQKKIAIGLKEDSSEAVTPAQGEAEETLGSDRTGSRLAAGTTGENSVAIEDTPRLESTAAEEPDQEEEAGRAPDSVESSPPIEVEEQTTGFLDAQDDGDELSFLQEGYVEQDAEIDLIIIDNDEKEVVEETIKYEELPTDKSKTRIKAGAKFPVVMASQISTKTARKGDILQARLKYDLKIGPRTVAKRGSLVTGHVDYCMRARTVLHSLVSPRRWYRNSGCIGVTFDEIINDEGEHIALNAKPARMDRIIKNKAEGRLLGVNHDGQITGPWGQQLRYKAVRIGLNAALAPAGVFSFGAMPCALGVMGAINPSFAFMKPTGTNVPHRRIKGFFWGFMSGVPGSWIIQDTVVKGQEAIIRPGDEFLVELHREFTGQVLTEAQLMPGASANVSGDVEDERLEKTEKKGKFRWVGKLKGKKFTRHFRKRNKKATTSSAKSDGKSGTEKEETISSESEKTASGPDEKRKLASSTAENEDSRTEPVSLESEATGELSSDSSDASAEPADQKTIEEPSSDSSQASAEPASTEEKSEETEDSPGEETENQE